MTPTHSPVSNENKIKLPDNLFIYLELILTILSGGLLMCLPYILEIIKNILTTFNLT